MIEPKTDESADDHNGQQPRVSILMGVYNCSNTLAESINSILRQSYTNWEFIICDDGSCDDTLSIAQSYATQNSRIRVIQNKANLGLAPTLDICAAQAKGELLARMDGDDISHECRLEKLVAALDANADISLVSCWMTSFDENGIWGEVRSKPIPSPRDFISGSPYCHAPCMMRRKAFEKVGGYGNSPWIWRVEDYNLWFKFSAAGMNGLNLQESLYFVRDDRDAENRRTFRARLNGTLVRFRGFARLRLPWWSFLLAPRPLLVWALPGPIYRWLHRRRLRKNHGRASS